MRQPRQFYVYIMTNRSRSHVLYTGVTGDLSRGVFEHKSKLVPGFTSRYNLTRLAYYECFFYPDAAIDREKEIKGLAPKQEDKTHRNDESSVGRLGGTVERSLQADGAPRSARDPSPRWRKRGASG